MDILVVIVVLIAVFALIISITQRITASDNLKELSKRLYEIKDFDLTEAAVGDDGKTGVAYDENQKKICLIRKVGTDFLQRVFDYKDILSVEILEDGNSNIKTDRGSQVGGALIGGLALGTVGLVVGSMTCKKKLIDNVERIDLQIIVNDLKHPRYIVNFLEIESEKSSSTYKSSLNLAREWYAILEVFIKLSDQDDKKNEISKNPRIENHNQNSFSIADEIEKLTKLRDNGVLTEIEFNNQKEILLNK